MAGVELQFLPPDEDDIVMLHVEESSAQGGPFAEIQTFPAGMYPDYIRDADVTNATSSTDWFRIRWQDDSGNYTPYSDPVQGGTTTVVAQVMDRVILRDTDVVPLIAGQESEAAVAWYYGEPNPYDVDPSLATPQILSGLTMLTLARIYTINLLTAAGMQQKWQAGLVSMDVTIQPASWAAIDKLIALANRQLGRNYSTVLVLAEVQVAHGYKQLVAYDASRALIELA